MINYKLINSANQALYLLLTTVAWIPAHLRWINIWQAQHWHQLFCHPHVNYLPKKKKVQGQSDVIRVFSEETNTFVIPVCCSHAVPLS